MEDSSETDSPSSGDRFAAIDASDSHLVDAGDRFDDSIAYISGSWRKRSELNIAIDDPGFVQSVTAVERLRTYGGLPFQVAAHFKRWQMTADFLCRQSSTDLPSLGLASLRGQLTELLHRNRVLLKAEREVGIVAFATPGKCDGRSLTIGLHLTRLDHRNIDRNIREGQSIIVTDVMQPPPESWSRQLKTRCRLHYYIADRMARQLSPGSTGMLLDQDGSVTESSSANIAVVYRGRIYSPPKERILHGITQSVCEIAAKKQGIRWYYEPITVSKLLDADEILLMGTTTGLWHGNECRQVKSTPVEDADENQMVSGGLNDVKELAIGPRKTSGDVFFRLRTQFDEIAASGKSIESIEATS